MGVVRNSVTRRRGPNLETVAACIIALMTVDGQRVTLDVAEGILLCLGLESIPVSDVLKDAADISKNRVDFARSTVERFRVESLIPDVCLRLKRADPTFFDSCRQTWNVMKSLPKVVGVLSLIAAALAVLVAPYFGFRWLYDEYWFESEWPEARSVLMTLALWLAVSAVVFARRFTVPFSFRLIRSVRRGLRRVEEETRP